MHARAAHGDRGLPALQRALALFLTLNGEAVGVCVVTYAISIPWANLYSHQTLIGICWRLSWRGD